MFGTEAWLVAALCLRLKFSRDSPGNLTEFRVGSDAIVDVLTPDGKVEETPVASGHRIKVSTCFIDSIIRDTWISFAFAKDGDNLLYATDPIGLMLCGHDGMYEEKKFAKTPCADSLC